jgi:hypothetical protein
VTEPRGPRWRAWAAIGLLVSVPAVAFLVLEPAAEPPAPVPAPEVSPTLRRTAPPVLPQPQAALGRAELIEAAARAASAFAAGAPVPAANVALAGRRFVLRLPFGCAGPSPQPAGDDGGNGAEEPRAGWSYDAESQTLRALVTPETWTSAPWISSHARNQRFEAVEGFWINRPWVRAETCPAAAIDTQDAAEPSRQTLAIAQFFEPGSKRAARRNGQPYRVSTKVAPEDAPGDQGLRLAIEGRLSVDPSTQPIDCWASSADQRPVCVIRARFSHVAITGPTGDTVYAEWRD